MVNSQVLMGLCDCNRIRTHNRSVYEPTLKHLAKLGFWLFSSKLFGQDRLVKSVKLLLFNIQKNKFSAKIFGHC